MTTPEQARKIAAYYKERFAVPARVADVIMDLARQVEELQADAERYRWIRDKQEGTMLVVNELIDWPPSEWDSEIDSKRKAK